MKDNIISDISYTNNDFNSIYTELLDTAKKLSDKWDPSLSNESDPGVVLLKLAAIVADKNNYHIDKNVLECFPISVTQQGNARNLYESLGYKMHWYKSGTTGLSFKLRQSESIEGMTSHTIPKWTMFTDSSSQNTYTLIEDVPLIPGSSEYAYGEAREGVVHDFTVNGSKDITLLNLDENLRLYFSDSQISENGIFISNIGANNWTQWNSVSNLASEEAGQLIYEFNVLPNNNICYIQFPADIADLISDGLNIKYLTTNGADGNVKAYTINSFYTNEFSRESDGIKAGKDITDLITVYQPNAVLDGENIEDLVDAYNNFKRTIGTFQTLVTCRDYDNYIYNLTENDKFLVSNVVTSDRTNDINGSCLIKKWSPASELEILANPSIYDEVGLTAYDLILYILNPINNIYTDETFANSFKAISGETDAQLYISIQNAIENAKSISHDFLAFSKYAPISNYVYICNNKYAFSCKLYTYYKVTSIEAQEIQKNVKLNLLKNLNARKMTFGQDVEYDTLLELIKESDSRIREVILETPTYSLNYQAPDGTLTPISSATGNYNVDLLAKMILSGHYQLFEFNDDFELDFGQTNRTYYPNPANEAVTGNIKAITTEVSIVFPANVATNYTLKSGEYLDIYKRNLVDEIQYTQNVKFTYPRSGVVSENITIPANTDYKLGYDMYLSWVDENNLPQEKTLVAGTVIRTSIDISVASGSSIIAQKLGSGQSITTRVPNESTLSYGTYCYWVLNNDENLLNIEAGGSYILKENEYFVYTDKYFENFVYLGYGTQITNMGSSEFSESLNTISLESLNADNADTINWYEMKIQDALKLVELQIITLGESTGISATFNSATTINNTSVTVPSNFTYGDGITLPTSDGEEWKVRSRLVVTADSNVPFTLNSNQSITFIYRDGSSSGAISGKSILFNYPISTSGENVEYKVYNSLGVSDYALKAYAYELDANYTLSRDNGVLSHILSETPLELSFDFTSGKDYLIPITVTGSATLTNCSVFDPYRNTSSSSISADGTYVLKVVGGVSSISFEGNGTIALGYISEIDGYNNDLGFDMSSIATLFGRMSIYDTRNEFDWTYKVLEEDKVEHPLDSKSFWDSNHLYNRITLAQWDMDNSSIAVASSSLK